MADALPHLVCVSLSKNSPQGQPLKSGCKSTAFTPNNQIFTRENPNYIHILTFDYDLRAKSAVLYINYINKKIHILRSIQQTNYLLTKNCTRWAFLKNATFHGASMYAAYTILNLGCFLDSASKRGMTVTESLAYSWLHIHAIQQTA